jgi:hypothetical protein
MLSPYLPTGATPVPPSDDWQVPVGPASRRSAERPGHAYFSRHTQELWLPVSERLLRGRTTW